MSESFRLPVLNAGLPFIFKKDLNHFEMDDMLLIRLHNQKVIPLLHGLERLELIEVIKPEEVPAKQKLSEKFKGVFTEEDAGSFGQHIRKMRSEWDDI